MQSDFANRFDELSAKLLGYDARIQLLEEKEKENTLLKSQVTQLQKKIHKLNHDSLRSDLEILGVTKTPSENPYHLVLTTASMIGVELDERDIDYVSRAGPRQKADANGKDQLPRPLVISFTRRSKREQFLKQAKARRTLDSRNVVGSGPERKLFVNERLTAEARRLFRSTREWAKQNAYKYCWVKNGQVYIRKRDTREGSPPIHIRSCEDLQRLHKEPASH